MGGRACVPVTSTRLCGRGSNDPAGVDRPHKAPPCKCELARSNRRGRGFNGDAACLRRATESTSLFRSSADQEASASAGPLLIARGA